MAIVGKRAMASITKVSSLVQVNSGWILYTFIPYDYPYQYKHFVLTCRNLFLPNCFEQVQSDTGQDLRIDSEKSVTLQGNEGLEVNGKHINLQADIIHLKPVSEFHNLLFKYVTLLREINHQLVFQFCSLI